MAKGNKTGGRQRGTPNKRTTEAVERERVARQAQQEVDKARQAQTKLGKDALHDYMLAFGAIAAVYQNRVATALGKNTEPAAKDMMAFEKWGRLTAETAAKLAEFQSPKFKAIQVMTPPANPPLPPPKQGNVVTIDDPTAIARVYQNMVKQVR